MFLAPGKQSQHHVRPCISNGQYAAPPVRLSNTLGKNLANDPAAMHRAPCGPRYPSVRGTWRARTKLAILAQAMREDHRRGSSSGAGRSVCCCSLNAAAGELEMTCCRGISAVPPRSEYVGRVASHCRKSLRLCLQSHRVYAGTRSPNGIGQIHRCPSLRIRSLQHGSFAKGIQVGRVGDGAITKESGGAIPATTKGVHLYEAWATMAGFAAKSVCHVL